MKLESSTSIFNMGDTSIRVKQIVDVNRVILQQLEQFTKTMTWVRNTVNQEAFYRSFLEKIVELESEEGIELFRDFSRLRNYTPPNEDKLGMRGRTLTNALVKTGLINSQREISPVGINYLNNSLRKKDVLEEALALDYDNLVYVRQFLKLRIYSSENDKYFYNFRFALKFLSKYSDVPQNDFLKIIESIKPECTQVELNKIIDDYAPVANNHQIFDEYYKNTFSFTLRSIEELKEVKQMFQTKSFTDENFIKYFNNRDNQETSLLYKSFTLALLDLVESESLEAFESIKTLSRQDKIKKAFGGGKIPFKFTRNETIDEFLNENAENPLLSADPYNIYLEFIFSKHNDLIREYSDMCRRTFEITALISFDKGLVNLSNEWIIKPLLNILNDDFILCGEEDFALYEGDMDSIWFNDCTFKEILGISDDVVNEVMLQISKELGISDLTNLQEKILDKREQEYRDFVNEYFPKEKVINILHEITARNDEKVFELVTDNASVPTIYEYILTIAWYHISEKKDYLLHKSFQVTLDGSKLPLTHRGGGAGDIEIITSEYALLIEATLMDKNTQKRGELEPVIRHSINFALNNKELAQIQTIFIANELDNNVINLFRATQFVQHSGTNLTGEVDGMNIFALTTSEFIKILEYGKNDQFILNTLLENLNQFPTVIKNGWREPIVQKLLS